MHALKVAPILVLIAFGAGPAPTLAQQIPDYIPDEPGQSLADREKERMEERFRGTLSRFFSTSSVQLAPMTDNGVAYQANVGVGMRVGYADALYLNIGTRSFPSPRIADSSQPLTFLQGRQWYLGAGYQLSGTRITGPSALGRRTALGLGMGVLMAETGTAVTVDIAPTYELMARDWWSLPIGVNLSLAMIGNEDAAVTRAFLGLNVGVRLHWVRRERVE